MVAALTLVGLVIGYASWVVKSGIIAFTPKYKSTATLFVATQTGTTTAEAYQNDMFCQQRSVSYAALATSKQVATRAGDQLKVPISPRDLQKKISTKPIDKTVMLDVSVSDSSPEDGRSHSSGYQRRFTSGTAAPIRSSTHHGSPVQSNEPARWVASLS
jgi:receptor protein-tyrosine kinase